jgi:uncharacterized protein (DUF433 family)
MTGVLMSRYALNLPSELKQEAEQLARQQGISLNQFILWSVAEKVGALKGRLDDPNFPGITYRRGASGIPAPVVRGTALRVETLVIDVHHSGMTPDQIAGEYDLQVGQVREALTFYDAHHQEIDALIEINNEIASHHGWPKLHLTLMHRKLYQGSGLGHNLRTPAVDAFGCQ